MKKIIYFILILSLISGCMNMSIYTDVDKSANFVQYKTYAWTPQKHVHLHKNTKFDNDIVETNIQKYVIQELNNRGLKLDTANPDLLIEYDIMTEKRIRQEQQPIYGNRPVYYQQFNRNGRGYRYNNANYNFGNWNNYGVSSYGYTMGYRNVDIPYQEGTLIIDIVDTRANKLIWKGYAIGEVDNPETFEAGLERDIKKMFKQYPSKIKHK